MKREINKLLSQMSEETVELLKEHGSIVAGGALTSIYTNSEVNDIDIYFKSEDSFIRFIDDVFSGDFTLICKNVAEKSVTFTDRKTGVTVQAIHFQFFENAWDVFEVFDYTINMCAYDFTLDKILMYPDFLVHNSARYLCFNKKTTFPIISLLRANKYQQRGYTISKPEMLKLSLTISQMDISSWTELKSHLGGMYGLNVDEIFPESEEFSIDKAVNTLCEINPDESFDHFDNTDATDPNNILKPYYDKYILNHDTPDISNRMFKIVTSDLTSFYTNCFSYKPAVDGGSVDGGKNGVFFYYGKDVLSGMYSYHLTEGRAKIIELHPKGEHSVEKSNLTGKWTLKGSIECPMVWTKEEFVRDFGSGDPNKITADDVFIAKYGSRGEAVCQ